VHDLVALGTGGIRTVAARRLGFTFDRFAFALEILGLGCSLNNGHMNSF
jgi:hypothetical protein